MQCPVCKKEYSMNEIGDHVDECLSSVDGSIPDSSIKSKRVFPFEDTNQQQSYKKYKPTPTSSNMQEYKEPSTKDHVPLSEKLRPVTLNEYIGQEMIIGPNTVLYQLLTKGQISSMILWGPPGCGKSSLAKVISRLSKEIHGDKVHIIKLSATSSGVSNIRDAVNTAKNQARLNRQTIVFMDEIHRFNKLQQDIFLPHVEAGTFTLIGTTTENPSYSLNSALLSRCRVFVLTKLSTANITEILHKAIKHTNGKIQTSQGIKLTSEPKTKFIIAEAVIDWLAEVCDGDARVALNSLELAIKTKVINKPSISIAPSIILDDIKHGLKQLHMLNNEQSNISHHMYSALHKSIQAGNSNASLYWLARIMAIKEDPVNIARRLVRISSEDVGLADIDALGVAVHTMHGCQMIGMPECDVLLGQCVVYLSRAPKSRLMYNVLKRIENIIANHEGPQPEVPMHIRCRSGESKLQASLGRNKSNLMRKDDGIRSHLPLGLPRKNFFLE